VRLEIALDGPYMGEVCEVDVNLMLGTLPDVKLVSPACSWAVVPWFLVPGEPGRSEAGPLTIMLCKLDDVGSSGVAIAFTCKS
jgi:hypothetical protein